MADFLVWTVCVLLAASGGTHAISGTQYGMSMTVRAYDAVCWYEALKVFPNTNTKAFNRCTGQAASLVKQITSDSEAMEVFGEWIKDPMQHLPNGEDYMEACDSYLDTPHSPPATDESKSLNDPASKPYPFQAFAYCLISTLRSKHGEKAIMAVQKERTVSRKNWRSAILDRDNEFRARHGSQPFEMNQELEAKAQRWADHISKECKMYHNHGDPDRLYQGQSTGQNIWTGGGSHRSDDAAYESSDSWYQEINKLHFPVPAEHIHGTGHFTQTVWKQSKAVGYGFAFNPKCGRDGKSFLVGIYFPAGNVDGEFTDNVPAPQY